MYLREYIAIEVMFTEMQIHLRPFINRAFHFPTKQSTLEEVYLFMLC